MEVHRKLITVAFDLDDTLYDRTQPLKKALSDFPLTKDLSFDAFYEVYQEISEIAFEKAQEGIWTLEESHIFRFQETLKKLGIAISAREALDLQGQYNRNQQHIELLPHIKEIFDFLHAKEIQTIILTNGPSTNQRAKIKNLGLHTYFRREEVIVSGEVNIAKPDLRIFELAERKFHLDKKRTWFVGDSYENDIVGADKAGWHTIWFNQNQSAEKDLSVLPTKTVQSTRELKEYILTLFQ